MVWIFYTSVPVIVVFLRIFCSFCTFCAYSQFRCGSVFSLSLSSFVFILFYSRGNCLDCAFDIPLYKIWLTRDDDEDDDEEEENLYLCLYTHHPYIEIQTLSRMQTNTGSYMHRHRHTHMNLIQWRAGKVYFFGAHSNRMESKWGWIGIIKY